MTTTKLVTPFSNLAPLPAWKACLVVGLLLLFLPPSLKAQANMRREGALTLNQTSDDTKGFYAATIDPTNGFVYFAAKYVYKVNLTTPGLPHLMWATTNLAQIASWQLISTNTAGADGSWQFTDSNATNYTSRFYRAGLP